MNLKEKTDTVPGYSIYLYLEFKIINKGKTEKDPSVLKDFKHIA
jgi:hypothetical protein